MGKDKKNIPVRSCISCRSTAPRHELLRLVLNKDGLVVADKKGVIPGRGAYVCKNSLCLAEVGNNRRLNRIFRSSRDISVSSEIFVCPQMDGVVSP